MLSLWSRFNRAKTLSLNLLVLLLLLPTLFGCAKGGSLGQHETREQTDYIVYFADPYGPYELSHYLLPEHEEVQAVTKLVHQYDLTGLNKVQHYVNNKLETPFEDVEIENISFVMRTGHHSNPGIARGIFDANVKAMVTLSYVQANSTWQAVYRAEFRLSKYDNIWKVDHSNYTLIQP